MFKSLILAAAMLLASPAWATWTFVNHGVNTACASGTTCAITVPSTGSGNLMVLSLFMDTSVNTTISSVSGAGTWTLCPASACHVTSGAFNTDYAYNLSNSSGVTTINVTIGTTSGGTFRVEVTEVSFTNGPISFDAAGTLIRAGACGVTPSFQCPMVALTLAGTNDVVFQSCIGNPNCNAISSPYVSDIFNGDMLAYNLNVQAVPAPYLTASSGSSLTIYGAVAFTETPSPNIGLLGGKGVIGGKAVIGGK
jgi:hypothetical protein